MTRTEQERKLFRVFVDAFGNQPPAEPPHVVDDEDLLARWSMGLLDAAEHEAIIHHLADCSECRELIALMVRNGALVLPVVEEPDPDLASAPATSAVRSGRLPLVLLALAAAVLIAVGLPLLWPTTDTRLGRSLALTEFDFELDGGSYARPVRVLPEEERLPWKARVEARPNDVQLRLEYALLLLAHQHADKAIEQFEDVISRQRDNTDALVGIGVALYEQAYNNEEDPGIALPLYRQSLEQFRRAAKRSPDDFAAQLNAAIVSQRLGEPADETDKYWDRAYELAPDTATKEAIEKHRT